MRRAIEHRSADNGLHRLGVTLHTYVDTWAHQDFSGIKSEVNRVSHLEAEDCTPHQWLEFLTRATEHLADTVKSDVLSRAIPLGHGAALHYPDQPWAVWSYTNGMGKVVKRVNLPDFVAAADMACRAVQGYVVGDTDFERQSGLIAEQREAIETLLSTNRSVDEQVRLKTICSAIELGKIPGLKECVPPYVAKGPGSWKQLATGIEAADDGDTRPSWSPAFEHSDYRKFHDATKEHRFVVTQEVLPAINLRLT